ncbi:MFS transporter [Caloranaerobacter ferrireducens]|uniref:MFS transporter n=1 Tax=Caloranaerobacter ferrireducens TaxID=1323370 RepID=UPI00084D3A2D|nr:MFS transporter [Caloranaerobacter ferrireducens]
MRNRISIPFTGILFGTAANMLMQTVIATILPQIMNEYGGWQWYGWVFSSFIIVSTITIPLFAKMADLYGYKKFYMIGMTIFIVGSLLCGLAPSMTFLIGARMVQGLGVGAIGPVTIALISNLFSLEKRGSAMGIYAATQLLSNVVGPILGGFIAQNFGWPWAFYMVIPVGLLSLLLIYPLRLPSNQTSHGSIRQLDMIGALLFGSFIALFIQGWTRLGKTGLDQISLSIFVASLVLFALFVLHEKRHPYPVIPPEFIRIKNVRLANITAFLIGLLMYGAIAILPLYSEKVLGNGSMNSGKLLIPLTVGIGLGTILSGRAVKKYSYKALAQIGWLTLFLSLAILTAMSFLNVFNYWIYVFIFTMGFGIGTLLPTFLLPAQSAVSKNEQAIIGGMVQLSRNSGGAIGIPILTGLLFISERFGLTFNGGYWLIFLFLCVCTLFGLFVGMQYKGSIKEELNETERV